MHLGAIPIFVDVLENQLINHNKIESKITKKTKAIMVVHLGGRVAEMDHINKLSKKYNIPVIEDAAQSIGSKYKTEQEYIRVREFTLISSRITMMMPTLCMG